MYKKYQKKGAFKRTSFKRKTPYTSNASMGAGDLKRTFTNAIDLSQGTTAVAILPGTMTNLLSAEDRNMLGSFGSLKLNYVVVEQLGYHNAKGEPQENGVTGLSYIDGDAAGGTTQAAVVNKTANTRLMASKSLNGTPVNMKVLYKPIQAADKGWIGTTAFLAQSFGSVVSSQSVAPTVAGNVAKLRASVSISAKMDP